MYGVLHLWLCLWEEHYIYLFHFHFFVVSEWIGLPVYIYYFIISPYYEPEAWCNIFKIDHCVTGGGDMFSCWGPLNLWFSTNLWFSINLWFPINLLSNYFAISDIFVIPDIFVIFDKFIISCWRRYLFTAKSHHEFQPQTNSLHEQNQNKTNHKVFRFELNAFSFCIPFHLCMSIAEQRWCHNKHFWRSYPIIIDWWSSSHR